MLPHTGLFLLGKVALQMRIRRRLKRQNRLTADHRPHDIDFIVFVQNPFRIRAFGDKSGIRPRNGKGFAARFGR